MKNTKLSKFWDTLRSSYWFLPTLIAGIAFVLALVLLEIDRSGNAPNWGWLYTGGPDGARAMLSTIASSMATVAGTAFSITIVALQLAASNFGPRLLRNFMQDMGNQIVLGTFLGTFLYCLLVLRNIRGEDFNQFVPQLSITVGMVLAIVSVLVLIYFIHHASTIIQVSQVITDVGRELDRAIDRLFPEQLGHRAQHQRPVGEIPSDFEARSTLVRSQDKGYLQAIDDEELMKIACQTDGLLWLKTQPGKYLISGSPLVSVYPKERYSSALFKKINRVFIFGKERTEQQDIAFPIQQLVEIALRAISPAVNDPFTAIRCIDRLGAGFSQLVQRDFPSPYRYDKFHNLRVIAEPVKLEYLFDCAFSPIRQYAQSDSAVMSHLLDAIALIASHAKTPEQKRALRHHAGMILRGSRQGLSEEWDRQMIEERYQAVLETLDQRQY
ncbi:DUF2254 domain-containing protein [Leptolyngbya sp. FACHB-711]|uniref:DUF2254 domain-containing protein n=1 Tax=Leptolyngbya sp. FACHB-711 TaxID=2692813 RepID=UPI00168A2D2F|nr:DUF2254 domain-containing protein [Leptolyngbya sp. FACHB-711]MBD1852784.1 DUF2254 domain-containing protein [Cyanobacteria bacterium FACHB-502]MBD2024475.1 DUF2254 domain-containing protein [Leptolyngbya sp. FACHB-711]